MNFGGGHPGVGGLPGAGAGGNGGMSEQEMQMVKYMQMGMESCPIKAAMAGVMGGALGGAFGLFMASMRYDTPLSSPINPANPNLPINSASATALPGTPGTQTISDLPLRQQLKQGFRDMGRSALSSARNFGFIGCVYSGTECCFEGLRAKSDLNNAVYAGFVTGTLLARKGGPGPAVLSGLGFAGFSLGIEWYMRRPESDD